MNQKRIALYIGNVLYPGEHSHPGATIDMLKMSPLTSPILSILNSHGSELVFNDPENPVFNSEGHYIGSKQWPDVIRNLRGGNIREVYLSFSSRGAAFMGSHAAAVPRILGYIKDELGIDG